MTKKPKWTVRSGRFSKIESEKIGKYLKEQGISKNHFLKIAILDIVKRGDIADIEKYKRYKEKPEIVLSVGFCKPDLTVIEAFKQKAGMNWNEIIRCAVLKYVTENIAIEVTVYTGKRALPSSDSVIEVLSEIADITLQGSQDPQKRSIKRKREWLLMFESASNREKLASLFCSTITAQEQQTEVPKYS